MAWPITPAAVNPFPNRLVQSRDVFDAAVSDFGERYLAEREAYEAAWQSEADSLRAALIAANLPSLTGMAGRKFAVNAAEDGLIFVDAMIASAPTIITTAGAGIYATPAGARALLIELVGAGQGGGGASASGGFPRVGAGGNHGGYASHLVTGSLPASYAYTVGAAGAGGSTSGGDGSAGGNTTMAGITADGGSGSNAYGTAGAFTGPYAIAAGLPGNLPNGNQINRRPGGAEAGVKVSDTVRLSGRGGDGVYGLGGTSRVQVSGLIAVDGVAGTGAGSGGSGGISSTTAGASGGAGGPGILIITPLF